MSSSKINSIQALRGIAVILVVYTHVLVANQSSEQAQFFYLQTWGSIGVDLFFAISGFIMTTILPKYVAEKHSARDFIVKRAIRILPLYWFISIIAWFFARHNSNVDQSMYIKTITILPIFDTSKYSYGFISQGWTLAYELYFYILIAIFLVIARKATLRNLLIALCSLSLIGCFVSYNYLINLFISPLLLEFILGILIGEAYKWISKNPTFDKGLGKFSWVLLVAGALVMFATIFADTRSIYVPHYLAKSNSIALSRVLIWGIPSAIFLMGVVFLELLNKIKIPGILIKIGDASYSCYLWHFLFLSKISKLIHEYSAINPDIAVLITIALILLLSWVAYRYIEQSLITFCNKIYKRLQGKVKMSTL